MDTWVEIADLFYCNRITEGMECFMSHAAELGQLPIAKSWITPLFDALQQDDYFYAADILRYEIAGK